MSIGFIGLGNLGRAIAQRLIDCGHDLVVYNRSAGKADGLKAKAAGSVEEVEQLCETIVICLFDSNAVDAVLRKLLSGVNRTRLIIDLTTNHHKRVLEFHELCLAGGCDYVEAPVLGSVIPASRGELTVLASGKEEAFMRAKSLLENLAKTIHHLPAPGLATKMKLINNLLLGSFMAAIAEAITLGESADIAREQVINILSAGAGNSGVFYAKKEKLLANDFSPQFSAALIYKDLGYLLELADDLRANAEIAHATRELYARTLSDDPHARDFSVILNFVGKKN
jgi:3-hydroxyisobutyrate dehydrogenase